MSILHYYNQEIITQTFFEFNKKMVVEINSTTDISTGSKLKAKISALFGGVEAEFNGELSREKNTKELIPDVKHVLNTLNKLDNISVSFEKFPVEENCIYKYEGKFQVTRKFNEQEKEMFVEIYIRIGKYKLSGYTSADRWKSKSTLNMMIMKKNIEGTILFQRLNSNKVLSQPIQILSISAWEK